jgi:prolyl 4-hydroxylase
MANGNGHPKNTSNCDIPRALKVPPVKGDVIIFYSLHSDGSLDETSLHGACPVEDGTKWAANKWIWYLFISREQIVLRIKI